MFGEKMTYERFMKDVYPVWDKTFTRYHFQIHADVLPLFLTYQKQTLGYYQNMFSIDANKVEVSTVFGGVFTKGSLLNVVDESIMMLAGFMIEFSKHYTKAVRDVEYKFTSNHAQLHTEPETKALLEGYVESIKMDIIRRIIPDQIEKWGRKNNLVYSWSVGNNLSRTLFLPFAGAEGIVKDNYLLPINKAFDRATSYFMEKQTPSSTQSLQVLRSQLLRTLQNL
jgi:hypothetical protein